jgi:hypothetical protein
MYQMMTKDLYFISAYSQIWLNIHKDDHHFDYKEK